MAFNSSPIDDLLKFRLFKNLKHPISEDITGKQYHKKIDLTKYNQGIILGGEINKIMVIDLDFYDKVDKNDPEKIHYFDKENSLFLNTFGNDYIKNFNTYTVQTGRGGYHLYFEFDNELKGTINEEHRIDVMTDSKKCGKKYIVGEGSSIDGKYYRCIHNTYIKKIPNDLKNFILTY